MHGENCVQINGDSVYEEHIVLNMRFQHTWEATSFGCTYLLGHGSVRANKNSLFFKFFWW